MGLALPFPVRIFPPSPKTLHSVLWLAVCAIIPASEGLGSNGAEIRAPQGLAQGLAVAASPPGDVPASAARVAQFIPEPVPVPTSWSAPPIVIDLK